MREPDLNANKWQLLANVTLPDDGLVRTTKVIDVTGVGCLVNVSSCKVDGSVLSEAVTFVPGVKLVFVKRIPELVSIK